MKKRHKKFLKSCNDDKENQVVFQDELKVINDLQVKGFVKNVTAKEDRFNGGLEYLMFLSKKGVKKVKKLQKKD